MPNLKIIGITGSYGKTSSKNILSDILNIKYNALPTTRNLNTYNGLIMTVNNNLTKFNDIFIGIESIWSKSRGLLQAVSEGSKLRMARAAEGGQLRIPELYTFFTFPKTARVPRRSTLPITTPSIPSRMRSPRLRTTRA